MLWASDAWDAGWNINPGGSSASSFDVEVNASIGTSIREAHLNDPPAIDDTGNLKVRLESII